ncbi:recombinase family protein [Latilactobacillus curvatus]|uniref:recombinase family protein n=1 Tax=Latilactobacillus curvatus TaxID=28038 RepID=UPI000FECABFC|nr:recombinase family protein [Latilactobacillus curvatus]QAR35201.1 recombinase family protein [Latilactobacillus curvatus]
MENKVIGYARTSTSHQDLGIEVQLEAFKYFKPDAIFKEQISGRKENRLQLSLALEKLEKGDTLLIYKLDRLSRSTRQLVNLMAELNTRGIQLKSISDGLDTSSPNGRFMFTIMSGMAELEAEMISSRTKDALARTDKKLGRPMTNQAKEKRAIDLYRNTNLTVKEIAARVKCCSRTVYTILKRNNIKLRV